MRKAARLAARLAATATALAGVAQALPASASTVQARTAAVPHVVKVTVPMKVTGSALYGNQSSAGRHP